MHLFEEAAKKASKKKNIMKMVKMAGPEKQLYFILEFNDGSLPA